jgi:branched-chain amino acid transport system substrate-binding protein
LNDDEGVRGYKAFFTKYLQGADFENTSYLTGYMQGMILEQILKQCGDDLSRKNIVKQAKSLSRVVLPTAFPGIEVNTNASSNMIWSQMQLQRWSGSAWEPFGGILDASSE